MFYPLNYKGLCSLSSLRSSVARLPWGNRNIGRMPFCECPLPHCATDRSAFVRLSTGKTKRAAHRFSIPHTTPATETVRPLHRKRTVCPCRFSGRCENYPFGAGGSYVPAAEYGRKKDIPEGMRFRPVAR